MARQSAPQTWRIAVDAVADLTTLFDARMSDGEDTWVNAAGVTHGKWCLDKTSALAVNGTTVVATLSGTGRWIYFGSGAATGTGNMMWFETIADMGAAPGPAVKTGAVCAETGAEYEFVPADATAANSWSVVANTGGTNGRWLLKGEFISIAPVGGGNPDSARIMLALIASVGVVPFRLELRAGSWLSNTQIDVPGQAHLWCEPGVNITTTVGAGVDVFKGVDTTTTVGALAATPTLNGIVFRDNTVYAVGDWVRIGGTGSANIHVGNRYQIKAITPGVPNVYTVDRPIQFSFVNGDPVRLISVEQKYTRLDGNGATITGPAEYYFQFQGRELRIRGWRCIATSAVGSAACSIELSSLECWAEDMYFDQTLAPSNVVCFLECGERSGYNNCGGVGGLRSLWAIDCVDCACDEMVFSGAASVGALISCHPTQVAPGCQKFQLSNSGFHGTANIGVFVQYATDTTLSGVSSDFNVQGFNVGGTGGVAVRTTLLGTSTKGNSQYTYVIAVTAVDTVGEGCRGVTSGAGMLIAAACSWTNHKELDCTVTTNFPVVIQNTIAAGAIVRFIGGEISMAAAGGAQPLVQVAGPTVLQFDQTKFTMKAAGQTAITDSAGTCVILREVIASQVGACNGYASTAAGRTLRRYGRVDFDTLTGAAITIFAGSFQNRGQFVVAAAGATTVVQFPDLKTGELLKLTLNTRGAVGSNPVIAYTPGASFSHTGVVNDTPTWDYEI